MALRTLETLKSYFFEHAYPTWQQFHDVLDSYRHKNDKVPITEVDGLAEQLNSKIPSSELADKVSIINEHFSELEESLTNNYASKVDGKVPISQLPTNVVVSGTPTVGESFGGGTILHILIEGEGGYESGKTKVIIAANEDASLSVIWSFPSSFDGTFYHQQSVGTTLTTVGQGKNNTDKLLALLETNANPAATNQYAIKLASLYNGGGFSDWYLPSSGELSMITSGVIPNISTSNYWSSSETNDGNNNTRFFNPSTGTTGWGDRSATFAVRSVRTAEYSTTDGVLMKSEARVTYETIANSDLKLSAKQDALGFTPEQAGVAQSLINALKSGVSTEGDTLKKLYDLILSRYSEITVATITERDAYNITKLPTSIFVQDDGDGRWSLYKALTLGVNASYVKISDPDLLNQTMSASQIAASYESNAGVSRFTTTLKDKLDAFTANFTAYMKQQYDGAVSWVGSNGQNVQDHILNGIKHITADERTNWNSMLNAAKQYTDVERNDRSVQNATIVDIITKYAEQAGVSMGWSGVRWNPTSPETTMTRTGDSYWQQLFADCSCVLLADDGTINATEATFVSPTIQQFTDNPNGQVMTRISRKYYREIFNSSGELCGIDMSNLPIPGFKLHEKFSWGNGRGEIYVSCFEGSEASGKLCSLPGKDVSNSHTIADFRALATARGTGWHAYDFYTNHLLQMLFYIYYADLNSQRALPAYSEHTWADSFKRKSGRTINLLTMNGYASADETGTDADLIGGWNDTMHVIANRFMWIENLYGHCWKFLDGCVFDGRAGKPNTAYLTPNPLLFSSVDSEILSRYINMNVDLPAASNEAYLKSLGSLGLPKTHGGDSATYVTDYFWSYLDDTTRDYLRVVVAGGRLVDGADAGVAARSSNPGLGFATSYCVSRLCYEKN